MKCPLCESEECHAYKLLVFQFDEMKQALIKSVRDELFRIAAEEEKK